MRFRLPFARTTLPMEMPGVISLTSMLDLVLIAGARTVSLAFRTIINAFVWLFLCGMARILFSKSVSSVLLGTKVITART